MDSKINANLNNKIKELAKIAEKSTIIDSSLYDKHDCKRGLRDLSGKGVLVGLTEISEIKAKDIDENGKEIPADGELYYRGYSIFDIVSGFVKEDRFGFEETTYLLLFGRLPSKRELEEFNQILGEFRELPLSFVRDVIMKRPSVDMMNVLARSVLTLYAYDPNPDDISISNVLQQQLKLISRFPLLSVYGYQVYKHYFDDCTLVIHKPDANKSTAENILHLLRKDSNYSEIEAKLLDLCLVLHAEHGGGNNSTFATHLVTSSGTDTYSAMAASLGSLKGPRHGGANAQVVKMMEDLAKHAPNRTEGEVRDYLAKVLDKKAFDKKGLIYGMGHAIYSKNDPRARILKGFVKPLAIEKDHEEEYELYKLVENLAPQVIAEKRNIYKGVCANIDFYSGFIYKLLGLPIELYTPVFAISRISGWSAHRIEELSNAGKIIRPAYKAVSSRHDYVEMDKRK